MRDFSGIDVLCDSEPFLRIALESCYLKSTKVLYEEEVNIFKRCHE